MNPPGSFVGRERELDALAELLTQHRLVTIAGEGGIGKTRLALQFAERNRAKFHNGIWFVRIADLKDPALVAQAVVETLHLRAVPGVSIEQTAIEHLANKQALLVFDEAERAGAGIAEFVLRLLEACPGVRVLLTSRVAATVASERVLQLESLDGAAQLFLDRVQAVRPDLTITSHAMTSIETVCGRLGGIPLAIELAAAHIATLAARAATPSVQRLDEHLAAYAALPASRQAPESGHYRALAAMLDWSHRWLEPEERQFFARLGAFEGSFTLAACKAIAQGESSVEDVAPVLDALVGKALIKCSPGLHGPRFHLHPVVREFAVERLTETGETARIRKRFCDYYCGLALFAAQEEHANVVELIESVSPEWENLRSALRTTLEHRGDVEAGCAAVLALSTYWTESGRLTDAWYWILSALEVATREPLHGKLLYAAAVNAHGRGDFVELDALCRRLVALHGDEREPQALARALNGLGNARYRLGDGDEAEALYRRALEQYRKAGDRSGEAIALMNLGALMADRRLDYGQARTYFLESLAIFGEFGMSRNVGTLLANLAEIDSREGDHARAIAYARKSRNVFDRLGNKGLAAWQLVNMAQFHLEGREFAESAEALREARPALREGLMSREHAAAYFDTAFMLAVEHHELEFAAQIYGYAQQFRELHSVARSPSEKTVVDPRFTLLENTLRRHRVEALCIEGTALDEAAIDRRLDALGPA